MKNVLAFILLSYLSVFAEALAQMQDNKPVLWNGTGARLPLFQAIEIIEVAQQNYWSQKVQMLILQITMAFLSYDCF